MTCGCSVAPRRPGHCIPCSEYKNARQTAVSVATAWGNAFIRTAVAGRGRNQRMLAESYPGSDLVLMAGTVPLAVFAQVAVEAPRAGP